MLGTKIRRSLASLFVTYDLEGLGAGCNALIQCFQKEFCDFPGL